MCASELNNIIFFSCPDCEDGQMRRSRFGNLTNYFKCTQCNAEIHLSEKTMKFMILPFKLPNIPPNFSLKNSNSSISPS